MSAPTDQQILDAFKTALIALATSQSYVINGRTLTRADLGSVRETISWLEARIGAADTSVDQTGTNILLANFN